MPAIATKEEAAELRALVRAGRLFDVQAWLEAGKPFRTNRFLLVPLFVPFEPCVAAVETGFFSMVECFLRCKLLKRELNAMLSAAVQKQRPDLVELLFNKGVNVDAVRFEDVLLAWNPDVIRIFLDRGADYKTNSPFAEAFAERRRTALGFFKRLLANEPQLINQANEALVEHVRKNSKKWVDLMLWLGADPRAEIPGEFEDESTTALIEAARYGRLDLLKRFKVDPKRDDLIELVAAPAAGLPLEAYLENNARDIESMEYLLRFGPDLQKPTKAGMSIIDAFFERLVEGRFPHRTAKYICCLGKHGMQWNGQDVRCRITDLRKVFRSLPKPNQMFLLRDISKAITPKALKALISTPAMRDLMNAYPIAGQGNQGVCWDSIQSFKASFGGI